MKNWHMIIGLPKTGSSWLGNMFNKSTDFNYFREFFNVWTWSGSYNYEEGNKTLNLNGFNERNLLCLPQAFSLQSKKFDLTPEIENNIKFIARPWEKNEKISEVFQKTWIFNQTDSIIDKEVWSFCNIGFFYKYFNLILLHRKANLIFWGTPETNIATYRYYISIYNSFLVNADYHDFETRKLIVKHKDLTNKCLTGYRLASHILFQEAEKYNLSVIDYESLLLETNTRSYLKNKICESLLTPELIANINNSKFESNFIQDRKNKNTKFKTNSVKFL
jgi:hypothetical protein